jgi:tRNA(fMet)-specific endonuclease VapC
MTMAYLIDTDWVIHYLNGHSATVERLEVLQEQGLALSVISLAELYEGIYYSRDPDRNEQALQNVLRGLRGWDR